MASAFAHALAAGTLGKIFPLPTKSWKFWLLGIGCSVLPDADVLTFKFGIDYGHWLGHRGFFHSLSFSMALGVLLAFLCFKRAEGSRWRIAIFLSLCAISHGMLDAMTTGGMGVGFFSPFDNTRYFFPWRPILVSPLSAARFFSDWGLQVLKSEAVYVGIPCFVILLINYFIKKEASA